MVSQQFSLPRRTSKRDVLSSVQRALNILELLAQNPNGLNAKQVSHLLGLNLSTCYHLLNTLVVSNYVHKDPRTACFQLTGKISYPQYHYVSQTQLVEQLTPHVRTLQEITQETAYLSLWDGSDIVLSAIIESPRSVRVKTLTIGYAEGNHATALGKAVLAYLSEAEQRYYLSTRVLPSYTPHTITSIEKLIAHLKEFRAMGYALDMEEYLPDVHCIGAPIFDAREQIIASIAISLPTTRHHSNEQALQTHVLQAADAATRTLTILGYTRLENLERERK